MMRERNPYFDNLKAFLIILVVLGHILSQMVNENKWILTLYLFIYTFHMPAFILVSGHLSKRVNSLKGLLLLSKKLLLPYVVFQVIYTVYYRMAYGIKLEFSIIDPRWALWFLLSMFLWSLLLNVIPKNKSGVLLAVIVALVAGYVSMINETLALARTLFFFPFFLMGNILREENFSRLKNKYNVLFSTLCLMLLFIGLYFLGNSDCREWLYGRLPYQEIMEGSIIYGFVYRLSVYICMVLVTYCFLSIVPSKKFSFTRLGSITLVVYLLHMFIVKYIQSSFIYDWVKDTNQYYVLFGLALVTVYVLTRESIVNIGFIILGIKKDNI